jgi:hypothetical protein
LRPRSGFRESRESTEVGQDACTRRCVDAISPIAIRRKHQGQPAATSQPPGTQPHASAAAASVPRLDWTEASARQRLEALGSARDPVEAIWSSGDLYRLAILRTGATADALSAVILSSTVAGWAPGMVNMTFTRRPASGGGRQGVVRSHHQAAGGTR